MRDPKAGRVGGLRKLATLAALAGGAVLLLLLWRQLPTGEDSLAGRPPAPSATASTPPNAAPEVVAADRGEAGNSARRDLASDEQLGGHTLARHVGRTDRELADRLAREAGVANASSFVDRATAEQVVGATLERERDRIASWMRRNKENLALDYPGDEGRRIGQVFRRGEVRSRPASAARVVLRKRGARYFVLTSYPVEP